MLALEVGNPLVRGWLAQIVLLQYCMGNKFETGKIRCNRNFAD